MNHLGESTFSEASRLATGLTASDIPHPEQVIYATARRTLTFTFNPRRPTGEPIPSTSAPFTAVIEIKSDAPGASWRAINRRVDLSPGVAAVVDVGLEDVLNDDQAAASSASSSSMDNVEQSSSDQTDDEEDVVAVEGVRVRICAADVCGPAVEADLVDVLPGHLLSARAFPTSYLIAIVVCCVIFLFGVLGIACCCCRKNSAKALGKGFDVDSPQ